MNYSTLQIRMIVLALMIIPLHACENVWKKEKNSLPEFEWMSEVGAKEYPKSDSIYNVKNYGALGDGIMLCTQSIQKAIDDCHANGGGMVTFDAGIYVTGSVFIKSGVNFHIPKGTMLMGSLDINDYEVIDTRVAGIEINWPAALLNIIGQNSAAISGDGILHGRGKTFWDKYWEMNREYDAKGLRWIVDYDCQRPRGIIVSNSVDITVKDIVIYQTGFWATHILYSKNVTVEGLTINNNIEGHGPSTDGIDIDSSDKILVQNCIVNCNDDNFCLKAGRDADGLRVNSPCEYIVIRNCTALAGSGLLTCGSETSGSIRNIVVYNMKGVGTTFGIRFKSSRTRGGIVENIYLSDFEMIGVHNCLSVDFDWFPAYSLSKLPKEYEGKEIPEHWKTLLLKVDSIKGMPILRDVYFENIHGVNAKNCIVVKGSEMHPVEGFHFKNITFQGEKAGSIQYAKDWTTEHMTITGDNISNVSLNDCENINL